MLFNIVTARLGTQWLHDMRVATRRRAAIFTAIVKQRLFTIVHISLYISRKIETVVMTVVHTFVGDNNNFTGT